MKRTAACLLALAVTVVPLAASAQVAVGMPVYANTAPPAPRVETQPPSPGPGYIWVGGYWNVSGSQYVWTPGRWEQPPQSTQMWEPPQWEREGTRYRFRPGRWGHRGQPGINPPVVVPQPVAPPPVVVPQPVAPPPVVVAQPVAPPQTVVVPMTPPPPVVVPMVPPRPRFERRPRPSAPNQVWVPGAWSWDGSQYVWNAGRWDIPPRPRARWFPPQTRRQGRSWVVVPGHWR